MEAKKVIVDIEINSEDIKQANQSMAESAKSSAELTKQLNDLKTQQKENNALYKVGAIDATENAKRQANLKLQMTEVSKSLRESNKQYQTNKTIVDAAKGSNEQLRARLSALTKQYNGLSQAERENSEEGKRMQATIKTISDKLKENEKAVGDNRRNVGNYESALKGVAGQINVMGVNLGNLATQLNTYKEGVVASAAATKASATATGGLSGALQILKVALISTGIGAIVVALGSMVTFLTQTKRGSELLAQAMAAVGATISVVVDRISAIGEAVTNVFTGNGSVLDVLGATKDGFTGITDEIVREAQAAGQLEKRMQALRDSERELTVEISKRKAEVAELQLIAEDETKTFQERAQAIERANKIQEEQMQRELQLQKERVAIVEEQLALGENLEEDEQRLAEERAKLGEIEANNLKKLRTLKAKENSIRNQEHAAVVRQENERIKLSKAQEEARKKAEEARAESFQKQRDLIDQQAELDKLKAESEIDNAEKRAEKIALIEEEALRAKMDVIDEETAAYTASVDAIGSVDEDKYAKQLALRAQYEAEIAEMDRAAKAEAFNREIELINGREQLEIESAELSIENTDELETEKFKIALKYAELRLELMRESALADDVLTEQELQNLQKVENAIKRIKGELENEEAPKLADLLGVSEEELSAIEMGMQTALQAVQTIQQAISQGAQNRLQEIEQRTQAEIASIEQSGLSEEQKDKKIQQLEKKAAQERYKIELEQFKASKATSIIMAIIQTAQAVMAAYTAGSSLGPAGVVAGPVMAAAAGVLGATQIGIIASQKPPSPPKLSKGGVLVGDSHASGGIPISVKGGGMVEAEGDEIILTKGVKRNPALFEKASALNVLGGGKRLVPTNYAARGGIVSPTFAARQTQRQENMTKRDFAEVIEAMPDPVVQVSEINRVQGRVANVSETSEL